MNIEALNLKPNTVYAVYLGHNEEEFHRSLEKLSSQGRIDVRGSSFIYLREGQSIEELSDEQLTAAGLQRIPQ